MKEGWILIFSAENEFKAKIAEDILKQHDIVSHILNEPDSAFPMIGKADLYAPQEAAAQAITILKEEGILVEE